jgi:hypothetical protein
VFSPKLPDGLAIYFHINGANLVTDVFVMSGMHHTPSAPKATQWCETVTVT